MHALVSGRARVALLEDNGEYSCVDADTELPPQVLPAHAAARLFSSTEDWDAVSLQTIANIRTAVADAVYRTEALDCCFFLFDENQSRTTHLAATELLDELLEVTGVQQYLEDIFLTKPLPKSSVRDFGYMQKHRRSHDLLTSIVEKQSTVGKVRKAWETIEFDAHIRDGKTRKDFESHCLRRGVFRRLVNAFGSVADLNAVQLGVCVEPGMSNGFPGLNMIMSQWVSALRKFPGANSGNARRMKPLNEDMQPRRALAPEPDDWPVDDAFSVDTQAKSGHRAYTDALSQVDRAVELATAGNDAGADKVVDQLIAAQLSYSSGESNAIRSLCNVASQLRHRSRVDFALKCLNRAIEVKEDATAYLQLAAVLIDVENFKDAEKALSRASELASQFDHGLRKAISSSTAHLYESQCKFDLALQVYDQIDPLFASEFDIQRADTLRKMGRFNEAMRIYVAKLGHPPSNDRALAGKAEIAKRIGKIHNGIQHYRKILSEFVIDDESRTVYELSLGNLYKLAGKTDLAISIATNVLGKQPFNQHATVLLGTLLGIQQKYGAARQELDSQQSSRAVLVRSLLDASQGNIRNAKSLLDSHIEETRLLLDERFWLKSGKVAIDLANGDVGSAKAVLNSILPISRVEKSVRQILQFHADSLSGVATYHLNRDRRLLNDWKEAKNAIIAFDLKSATYWEFAALLKCA